MSRYSHYSSTTTTDYPVLREALAPRFRALPDEDIEALLESYNLSAEDMEGFFDTLRDIGQTVVRAAPAILPVAGGVVGTIFGGPAGTALGSALGSAAGGAISQATAPRQAARTTAPPQRRLPASPGAAGVPMGAPTAGAPALPGAGPAASQLLQTALSPQMIQAMLQGQLGQLGAPNVQVQGRPVPVGAFTNLLSTLANLAQSEYNAANEAVQEGVPEYLRDYAGEAIGDPAVSEHRARVLLEMIQEDNAERSIRRRRKYRRRRRPAAWFEDDEMFFVESDVTEFEVEAEY